MAMSHKSWINFYFYNIIKFALRSIITLNTLFVGIRVLIGCKSGEINLYVATV